MPGKAVGADLLMEWALDTEPREKRRKAALALLDAFADSCDYVFMPLSGKDRFLVERVEPGSDETRSLVVSLRSGGDGRIRKGKDGFELDFDPDRVFEQGLVEEVFRAMGRKPKVMRH